MASPLPSFLLLLLVFYLLIITSTLVASTTATKDARHAPQEPSCGAPFCARRVTPGGHVVMVPAQMQGRGEAKGTGDGKGE